MLKKLVLAFLFLLLPVVASASILGVQQGGTASSTLSGILIGNGISQVSTLTIGSNLTLTGTTLSASGGGGGGSGTVGTSTNETQGFLSYWTTNSATPALLGKVATSSIGAGTGLTFSGTAGAQVGGTNGTYSVNTTQNITTLSNLSTAGTVNTTASGVLYSTATSTPSLGLGLSYSGTLGQFIGGVSGSLTIATSSLYSGTTGQVPYFNGTNSLIGTSSIFISTAGNVGIAATPTGARLEVQGTTTDATGNAFIAWDSGGKNVFNIANNGSTTISNFGACNTTNALTTSASGVITCGAITGGSGSPFPFTPINATSVSTSSGLVITASSTIGNGNQDGGLTISGGATTTGLLAVTSLVGTSTISDALYLGTTTIGNGNNNNVGVSRLVVQSRVAGGNALSILSASGVRQVSIDSTGSINATGFTATSLLSGFNLRSALGTAAIPSVSWGNANSSGLFGIASGFALSSNGVERGRFSSTGQFGLGTGSTSPQANLDIMLGGTSAVTANLLAFNIASSSKGLSTTTLFSISNTGALVVASSTPMPIGRLFTVGSTTVPAISEATTTIFLDSASTKGTCIASKDLQGGTYTYLTTQSGVLTASTVNCQ